MLDLNNLTLKFRTIRYDKKNNEIIILDQTKLPEKEVYVRLKTVGEVYKAIRNLQVRGAPLIGVTAAYGMVLSAYKNPLDKIIKDGEYLKSARPTAINLAWAIERMKAKIFHIHNTEKKVDLYEILLREAELIEEEDREACKKIGEFGARLVRNDSKIMVHCNAGALATSGIGTALGILYTAKRMGKRFVVYSCETRPLLQGARLTTWELTRNGIETYAICDNMVATYMPDMDMVLVGADRIALNGDTANKIGTKGLAIIANYYKVPFYVAAPISTFDFSIASGDDIPIEFRCADELLYFNKKLIISKRAKVCNPAFDVTPAKLITGIVTEKGIINPPFKKGIKSLKNN
jgi:methylthioribose-1-phosphate isomerase|uniref:Methylthioribose-1-phosphate isomerase n=1 Tax=candidate division WOR-3 bacterium TaxID=2052148 RepID=A0A7V3RI70_UNCW3